MSTYLCNVVNKTGEKKLKKIDAVSELEAKNKLFSQGYIAVSIIKSDKDQSEPASSKSFSLIKLKKIFSSPSLYLSKNAEEKKLAAFTRQLCVLLQASVPLIESIQLLIDQEKNPRFKIILIRLANVIDRGGSLSEAMKQQPEVFKVFHYNIIQAGEASSRLEETLGQLTLFLERQLKIKNKLRSAMIYPSIVIVIAVATLSLLTLWVVPQFQLLFAEVLKDQSLPPLTQAVVYFSQWINHYGWLLFLGFFGFYLAYQYARRKKTFHLFSNELLKCIPFIKNFFNKGTIVHFSSALNSLLKSRVPLSEAVDMAINATGDNSFIKHSKETNHKIKSGQSLAASLETTIHLPKMMINMIKIGEETGRLTETLQHIISYYEEEVDRAAANLTTLIEPAMTLVLALIVGLIVVALFLPIISIMGNMSGF